MQVPFFNSLRFKVGFGYLVLFFINIAVTAWIIFNFGRLTFALNSILNENYPNIVAVENMARSIEHHEIALSLAMNQDVDSARVLFGEAKNEYFQWYQEANKNRVLPDAGAILDDITLTYQGYLLVADSLFTLTTQKDFALAKTFYSTTMQPFSQRLTENCFWLIEENQKDMSRASSHTKGIAEEAIIAVIFATILAAGLSIMTMLQFTRRIIKPAERLTETVYQIGRGRLDLKTDIETNDEIGELSREFNKMTERLRKFEELNIEKILAEKQKSETIVENISDAIIVCDPDAKIQLMNHSAEELLNIREADALGRDLRRSITDKRLLEIFEHPSDPTITSQPFLQFQFRGRQVYLRPRVSEIPSIHGERGGVVLVLQDVTQFKELDKLKSDFMAAVSHEFRTPLTSINMGVDILRQKLVGPLTRDQEELLNASKQDCERLTKLVRELLQLSKLESGKIDLREELVAIGRVIDTTVQPYQIQFKEKGVELRTTVDHDLPPLTGDEQQFSWVISNLVNNALRHTDAGGSVEIRAAQRGEYLMLDVADTGRGIPAEFIDKIFDKFVQVKQSLNSTPGSVGLGLAIAKEIVEMYGGNIRVKSTVGKGTTFTIRLPFAQVHTV